MIIVKGKITNPSGLTSRLSADLVGEANHYKSDLTIVTKDERADLKSIMNVMALVVAYNQEFKIEIEGPDEVYAAEKMTAFLEEFKQK